MSKKKNLMGMFGGSSSEPVVEEKALRGRG